MAIKAADTLEPNGDFALAEAKNITITIDGEVKNLASYIENLEVSGASGKGISSITKTSSSGTDPVVDTYTISYTDGSTSDTFTVTNGKKGDKGATGATGATGAQGEKGDKGDAFTYADFTSEQLAALKGDKGDTGAQGETGAKGDTGSAAHVTMTTTTDSDGTQHVYVKTWEGDDETAATTSPDLMGAVNNVASAIEEIMSTYTASASTTSE